MMTIGFYGMLGLSSFVKAVEGVFASNKNSLNESVGLSEKYVLYYNNNEDKEKRITIRGRNDYELFKDLTTQLEKIDDVDKEDKDFLLGNLQQLVDKHTLLYKHWNARLSPVIRYDVYKGNGKFYRTFSNYTEAKASMDAFNSITKGKKAYCKQSAWEMMFVIKDNNITISDEKKEQIKNYNEEVRTKIKGYYEELKAKSLTKPKKKVKDELVK